MHKKVMEGMVETIKKPERPKELVELEAKVIKTKKEIKRMRSLSGTYLNDCKKAEREQKAIEKGVHVLTTSILRLSNVEIELIKAFLAGRAVIVYKDEIQAIEEAKSWYVRVDAIFRKRIEGLLDKPDISERVLLDAFKEVSSRVVAPKQEIIVKDNIKQKSDKDLFDEARKIMVVIEKSKKRESGEGLKTGRPRNERF